MMKMAERRKALTENWPEEMSYGVAAAYLDISEQKLREMVAYKEAPPPKSLVPPNKMLRFMKVELDHWRYTIHGYEYPPPPLSWAAAPAESPIGKRGRPPKARIPKLNEGFPPPLSWRGGKSG